MISRSGSRTIGVNQRTRRPPFPSRAFLARSVLTKRERPSWPTFARLLGWTASSLAPPLNRIHGKYGFLFSGSGLRVSMPSHGRSTMDRMRGSVRTEKRNPYYCRYYSCVAKFPPCALSPDEPFFRPSWSPPPHRTPPSLSQRRRLWKTPGGCSPTLPSS